jgi:hypothetical protein
MRSRYVRWIAATRPRWVCERSQTVGTTRGCDRLEERSRTEWGTRHAKCWPGCPQPPSPRPHKEGPSTGMCLEELASVRRQWVERVGLGPSVVQKRAEEWEVELEPCDAILSRNRIPPPRLTALQAIILQWVAIGNSPATRSFKQIRLIY